MSLLIPFALRRSDGKIVDALGVARGKKCECICPQCGSALVARHCKEKISHFAHYSVATCEGAYESSLHVASKQIIIELGFVVLPESILSLPKPFIFNRIEVEKNVITIRPDLTLYTKNGKALAVEIFVTHPVTDEKLTIFRSHGLACVEYDLSKLNRDISYEQLKSMFANGLVPAVWVFNLRAEALSAEFAEKERLRKERERKQEEAARQRQLLENQREFARWLASPHAKCRVLPLYGNGPYARVIGCPIRRSGYHTHSRGLSAFYLCIECGYCIDSEEDATANSAIRCIGHFPKLALEDIEILKRFGVSVDRLIADAFINDDNRFGYKPEPDPYEQEPEPPDLSEYPEFDPSAPDDDEREPTKEDEIDPSNPPDGVNPF